MAQTLQPQYDTVTSEKITAPVRIALVTDLHFCKYGKDHEFWSHRIDEMLATLRACQVEILEGRSITLEVNDQKIDPDAEYYTDKREVFYSQLDAIEKTKDESLFSILLAHRPSYIESYLEYDFDLVLSGHAHGGQWRIPFLVNGVYAPDEE